MTDLKLAESLLLSRWQGVGLRPTAASVAVVLTRVAV